MADDKKKKTELTPEQLKNQNWERLILAVAILGGSEASSYGDLLSHYPEEATGAMQKIAKNPYVSGKVSDAEERLSEQDVQKMVRDIAVDNGQKWLRITTAGDDRVCKHCAQWKGKIVSMGPNSQGLPTVDDFINSRGLHYNCRCSLQELSTQEIQRKGLLWKN